MTPLTSTQSHQQQILVFTDLDGSLLDHHSYRADAALDALHRLRKAGIPVIFNTSKTLAECEILSVELDIVAPVIVENGSAICFPVQQFEQPPSTCLAGSHWCQVLGVPHEIITSRLDAMTAEFRFLGISSISIDQIRQLTGLSPEAAQLARQRQYSEPLIWQDSEEALRRFRAGLTKRQLHLLKGGRFHHVLGQTDKGQALQVLSQYYAGRGKPVISIALGDGANDIDMLARADHPVLIRSPAHPLPPHDGLTNVWVTDHEGPAGWAQAIHTLLDRLDS